MVTRMESWDRLTRLSQPVLVVVGRPLPYRGEVLPIGTVFNDPTNPVRSRQFYEQRRIAPISSAPVARRPSDLMSVNPASSLGPTETVGQAPGNSEDSAELPPNVSAKPATSAHPLG